MTRFSLAASRNPGNFKRNLDAAAAAMTEPDFVSAFLK
jgi:hypothetical protein